MSSQPWLNQIMIRFVLIAVLGLWLQAPHPQALHQDVAYLTPLADQQSVPPSTDNSDTPEAIIIAVTEPLQQVKTALPQLTSAAHIQLAFALAQIRAPPAVFL